MCVRLFLFIFFIHMGLYIFGLAVAGSGRCFFVCISGEGAFANVVQKWDFCAFLHNEQEIRSLYYLLDL